MPECKITDNKEKCPCTFTSCSRHGLCCDCLNSHLSKGQLPACAFPPDIANTSERSIDAFINLYRQDDGSWL